MNQIDNKLNIYFHNIESNIKNINDDYFINNYYNDYESFLEYPNEINLRLAYMVNELENFSKKIKEEITQNYEAKKKNQIDLIMNYSLFYTKNSYKLIKNEIYQNIIFEEYFRIKLDIINNSFQKINSYDDLNNISINKIEYDPKNKEVIERISQSINDIELIINDNFTNFTNDVDYSKYNFYIMKLRTSIYYTKNAINLFENLNIKFNLEEKYLLNKLNITTDFHLNDISNQSMVILKNLNEKSYNELTDYFIYFKEGFDPYIIHNEDYNDNIEQFRQIINDTETFTNIYLDEFENATENILNVINQTLNEELIIIKNEGIYNYNYSNYNYYFKEILKKIKKLFDILLDNSHKFGYNHIFTNLFMDKIDELHSEKNLYFKKLVKSFQDFYNINFFNFTLDLGDYIENYMKDLHENNFNFTYDYVNILENFLDNKFHNETIYLIKKLNETTISTLYIIFEYFIINLNESKSDEIKKDYIEELYHNRSECANYTLEHLNDEEQIIYLNFDNCSLLNESLNQSFNESFNESLNDSSIEEKAEKKICPFFNKTSFILYCNDSNYFNQKEFYYENVTIAENLSELIEKLEETIRFYLNPIKLSELLYNNTIDACRNNLSLNDYFTNITMDNFEYEFLDFEMAGEILTYNDNEQYKKFINELLLKKFNDSIFEFFNNFIIKEIEFKINIDALEKYNIKLCLFEEKLENNLQYYLYLLENSDSIGVTTKKAFLNLYNDMERELNLIIKESNDDLFYDFDSFYITNKRIFINEYHNYLKNNINKIFKLEDYIDKFFSNHQFDNSLEKIINYNIKYNFMEKIKNNINRTITNKIDNLSTKLKSLNQSLYNIINKVNISDLNPDMIPIINKTDEYNNIINNQQNSFSFNINEHPYELFLNFTNEYLEPPLNEIKKIYDKIQDELLAQIFKKIDDMPNYYLFLIEKYCADDIISYISNATFSTEDLFLNYTSNLTDESDRYKNEFNDLRRLYNIKKKLYLKQRKLKGLDLKNNSKKFQENQTNKINYNLLNQNNRKLNTYDDGYLCFTDLEKELASNMYIIGNFSVLYLNKDFRYLNTSLKNFNNKILVYLRKLENPLSIITLRMSIFLTEEKLEEFKNKIYKEMNLIKEYINKNAEIITSKIDDFMYLLSNTTIVQLKDLQNSIKYKVEKLYDDLLVYIMSKFNSKSFKFTQADLNNYEIDLTGYITEGDKVAENIAAKSKKTHLGINFDSEEYINDMKLDNYLGNLE